MEGEDSDKNLQSVRMHTSSGFDPDLKNLPKQLINRLT